MIAVDTSSLIAYLQGDPSEDVEAVDRALSQRAVFLPPVVLSEILSDPKLSRDVDRWIRQVPLLPILDGYWERVGILRSKVLSKGLKARLADALIAQNCLDYGALLITRDSDFQNFAKVSNLKLL